MKHAATLLLLAILINSYGFSQEKAINFTIKGKLLYSDQSTFVKWGKDLIATLAPDRSFEIKGSLPKPGQLFLNTNNSYPAALWIDEGEINITIQRYYMHDTDSARGKKSFLKVVNLTGPAETKIKYQIDSMRALLNNRALPAFNSVSNEDSVSNVIFLKVKEYLTTHPTSFLIRTLMRTNTFNDTQKKDLFTIMDKTVDPVTIGLIETDLRRNTFLQYSPQ